MIAANDRLSRLPRGPVRPQQARRINLKRRQRIGSNIGRRHNGVDPPALANQQSAGLGWMRRFGVPENFRNQTCENFDRHSYIVSVTVMPESTQTVTLTAEMAGWRFDRALAAALPQLSRERLKALINAGAVSGPAGLLRDPSKKISGSEMVTVRIPEPAAAAAAAQDIALDIVFEDDHLLVVDKPAGLVVHPAAGNLDGTLVNALLHHCAGRLSGIGGVARPGIVHRIDKDTSGLLVVAKTDPAHVDLSRQFAAHSVRRLYLAVVAGRPIPPAGRIEGALARSSANRQKMAIVEDGRGKHAVTHYRTLQPLLDATAVECRLETGRTHQVRVHMASIGHPLLGDPAYGRTRPVHKPALTTLGFTRQALHARTLGFQHPVSKENLSFESPVPADIQELIGMLLV